MAGEALVLEAEEEDPEANRGNGGIAGAQHFQRKLMEVVDDKALERVSARLYASQQWSEARKVKELRDPSVNHDWLWGLNRAHGTWMPLVE